MKKVMMHFIYIMSSQSKLLLLGFLLSLIYLSLIKVCCQHIKPAQKQSKTFFLALRVAADKRGEFSLSLSLSLSLCEVISLLFIHFSSSGFMDAAKLPQSTSTTTYYPVTGLVKPMEDIVSNTCTRPMLERKARPQEQLNCPRCNSTNTKFCYYNNYSLTQPRYFCKTCRRYWTEGGSLRNVPVGGGSRKNKRSLSSTPSSSSSSATSKQIPDLNPPNLSQFSSHHNPKITHKGQDLNLAFQVMHESGHDRMSPYVEVPKTDNNNHQNSSLSSSYTTTSTSSLSALDLLRTGIASRGLNTFIPTPMPDSNTLFSSGFPLQDVKPTLNFSIDGLGNRFGTVNGVQENGTGRLFFPFGEMKPLSNSTEVDQNKGQGSSSGYWNGMLGGGSW